ncbi:MAG: hypothetical protein MZV70_19535 [Desulfobacterales bacterium]|nr:hypothetical protein [Desulfobacterales bacterium]
MAEREDPGGAGLPGAVRGGGAARGGRADRRRGDDHEPRAGRADPGHRPGRRGAAGARTAAQPVLAAGRGSPSRRDRRLAEAVPEGEGVTPAGGWRLAADRRLSPEP